MRLPEPMWKLLLLAYVDRDITQFIVDAYDHTLIDRNAGADKEVSPLLCVKESVCVVI